MPLFGKKKNVPQSSRYAYNDELTIYVETALKQQTRETYPGINSTLPPNRPYYLSTSLGLDDSHGTLIVKASVKQCGYILRLDNPEPELEVKYNEKAILEYAFNKKTQKWEIRCDYWVRKGMQPARRILG